MVQYKDGDNQCLETTKSSKQFIKSIETHLEL